MLKSLWNKVFSSSDGQEGLLHKSFFTFGIKTLSAALGFFIVLLLARVLGADQLGHYQYAFTWTSLFALFAVFGFDRLLVREVPKLKNGENLGKIKGLLNWTTRLLLPMSIVVTGLAIGASFLPLEVFENPVTKTTYRLAALTIPLGVFIAQRRSTLAGLKQVVVAHFAEKLVQPGSFLLILCLVWGYTIYAGEKLDAPTAIILNIVSVVASLIYVWWLSSKHTPKTTISDLTKSEKSTFARIALPIFGFNLAMLIFARLDILMLRPMESAEAVGIYSIPLKLAHYMNFILVAFNSVVAPNISELFSQGKKKELQQLVAKVARTSTMIAVPVGLVLIFGRDLILPIFGEEYAAGSFALVVLVLGQVGNLICGPVGNLLIMTKHEWIAMTCFAISTAVNYGLNLWLIPIYGFEGAAIGTAASLILNNLLMLIFVVVKLKINPTAFYFKSTKD